MAAEKILVPAGSGVPAVVLYKGHVTAQVHGHGRAADRASGDELGGNLPILLPGHHLPHRFFVVVGFLVAGLGALPQAVVPLGVKQALFVKPGKLELVVHIGGDHEIILVFHQLQQVLIRLAHTGFITVDQNHTAPPGPVFLQGIIGIESPGIHIMEAVFCFKIRKILLEPFPAVRETGGGGHSCACADDHGVGAFYFLLQPFNLL